MNDAVPSSADYANAARRLRARNAGNPHRLLNALRDLSDRYDKRAAVAGVLDFDVDLDEPQSTDIRQSLPPTVQFAQMVADDLNANGLFTYSRRSALVKQATGMGIDKFEANLVIAVQQHRMRDPADRDRFIEDVPADRPRKGIMLGLTLILIAEIAAIVAAWLAFFR